MINQKDLQYLLEELINQAKDNTIQTADELIEKLTNELLHIKSLQL